MIRRIRVVVAAVGVVLVAGLGPASRTAALPQAPPASARVASAPPRLVLLIAVDQMRYDYLTRFRDRFRSGFARLLGEGAVFTNAYLEHFTGWTATRGSLQASAAHTLNGTRLDAKYDLVVRGLEVAGGDDRDEVEHRVGLPFGLLVSLLKDSSLAYVIGVVELSNIGNRIQAATFEPIPAFVTVAAIYLILTSVLTQISGAIEKQLDVERHQ